MREQTEKLRALGKIGRLNAGIPMVKERCEKIRQMMSFAELFNFSDSFPYAIEEPVKVSALQYTQLT